MTPQHPQAAGLVLVPCPNCTDGFPTSGDRHARTKMDVCGTCGGTHMVPALGQEVPTGQRVKASTKAAPVVTADFGRRSQDGEPCVSLVANGAVFATGTFPGTLQHAMAFAGQINAIPAARDAMLAVLEVCRSDETDVELPSSVIERVRDALVELGGKS